MTKKQNRPTTKKHHSEGTTEKNQKFQVREKGTNALRGTYCTFKRANNKRDKLDDEYGAYKYVVIKLRDVKK